MTKKFYLPLVTMTVLAFLVSPELRADPRASARGGAPASSRDKRIEKSFDVQGRLVSLEGSSADIVVAAGEGDEARLVVDLEYWSSNDEWMRRIESEFDVELQETSGEVSIRLAEMPDAGKKGWFKRIFESRETFYSVSISLEVPPGTDLAIDNRYGDVEVDQIGGRLDLVNTSGDVVAVGINGGADIENSYGDVTVTDVEGDLTLTVSSGTAEVSRVTGNAKLSSRYGEAVVSKITGGLDLESSSSEIEVQEIGGPTVIVGSYADARVQDVEGSIKLEVSSGNIELTQVSGEAEVASSYSTVRIEGVGEDLILRSSSGEVEIRDVGGEARVENSYGAVVVEDVRGSVEINNPSGGVTVEEVAGDVSIRSSYEVVRVRKVTGGLNVSATSAGVTAEEIGGRAEITTSYAGVELVRIGGPVEVRNQSGRVEVRDLGQGALAGHNRVETSYGDVDFSWPEGVGGMTFNLEATYGAIHSDFAAVSSKRGSREIAEGRVGDEGERPAATVSLTARSGSIFMRAD